MTTVTVLGAGTMGSAMARRLAAEGFTVRAWNRTAAKLKPLESAGVRPEGGVEDAVRGADAVITMLPTGSVVASVAERFLPAMGEDAVWLQTSTVGGPWTDRLHETARHAGRTMLDAPVSDGGGAAERGALTVIVSGPESAVERAGPVLAALASRVLHVGAGGEASRIKLIVSGWTAASVAAMAGTLSACRRLGADPAQAAKVLEGGPFAMPYALDEAEEVRDGARTPGFPVALGGKDLDLLIDELGDAPGLYRLVRDLLERPGDEGLDREDAAEPPFPEQAP